jgi:hypothetical protein
MMGVKKIKNTFKHLKIGIIIMNNFIKRLFLVSIFYSLCFQVHLDGMNVKENQEMSFYKKLYSEGLCLHVNEEHNIVQWRVCMQEGLDCGFHAFLNAYGCSNGKGEINPILNYFFNTVGVEKKDKDPLLFFSLLEKIKKASSKKGPVSRENFVEMEKVLSLRENVYFLQTCSGILSSFDNNEKTLVFPLDANLVGIACCDEFKRRLSREKRFELTKNIMKYFIMPKDSVPKILVTYDKQEVWREMEFSKSMSDKNQLILGQQEKEGLINLENVVVGSTCSSKEEEKEGKITVEELESKFEKAYGLECFVNFRKKIENGESIVFIMWLPKYHERGHWVTVRASKELLEVTNSFGNYDITHELEIVLLAIVLGIFPLYTSQFSKLII